MRFKNKTVIVTGAGSGIGETTAIKFAQEGANVVIADIDPMNGNTVTTKINDANGSALFVETDVASFEAINEMVNDHKKIEPHEHELSNPIHLHGTKGEEIAVNPMNKSFWIGMLHGLAGTGGALTSALVLSSTTVTDAILILAVESLGIKILL